MPDWLSGLFENGAIVGIAAAILIVETVVLLWMRIGPRILIFNTISGIALLMALGGALVDPRNLLWIAACLTAGLIAHLGDVWMRIKETRSKTRG